MKPNSTGRNKDYKHIRIARGMFESVAFKSLSPNAVVVFLHFLYLYNGGNNGDIGYSCRQARAHLRGDRKETPSPTTASRAFEELVEKGFIKIARDSSFNMKQSKSRRYTLTCWPLKSGIRETNDWAFWKPVTSQQGNSLSIDAIAPRNHSNCKEVQCSG